MATMSERVVRAIAGPDAHIEPGDATGEWVVASTACWSPGDVLRAIGHRGDTALEELRQAAGEAGDREQVELCNAALAGDREALDECARVIVEGAAQR
jgi:hypothetical protein